MSPRTDRPKLVALRFKWISESKFKAVNSHGYEKLIDFSCGFK